MHPLASVSRLTLDRLGAFSWFIISLFGVSKSVDDDAYVFRSLLTSRDQYKTTVPKATAIPTFQYNVRDQKAAFCHLVAQAHPLLHVSHLGWFVGCVFLCGYGFMCCFPALLTLECPICSAVSLCSDWPVCRRQLVHLCSSFSPSPVLYIKSCPPYTRQLYPVTLSPLPPRQSQIF